MSPSRQRQIPRKIQDQVCYCVYDFEHWGEVAERSMNGNADRKPATASTTTSMLPGATIVNLVPGFTVFGAVRFSDSCGSPGPAQRRRCRMTAD
jgi:hypothetical protein